jgi:thiol-disulfide isomerase/thioredoxin
MRALRLAGLTGMLGLLLLLRPGAARPQEKGGPAVDLKLVRYDGLAELIRKNRGKVILVDFWADTCVPCKRAMPHLVRLANKHRKDGLVTITVSVDKAWEQYNDKTRARLLKFLRETGADFTNLVLDESKEVLEEKLRVTSVPSLYVFDRQGRWTQFAADDLKETKSGNHPEVDALVEKLLKEK